MPIPSPEFLSNPCFTYSWNKVLEEPLSLLARKEKTPHTPQQSLTRNPTTALGSSHGGHLLGINDVYHRLALLEHEFLPGVNATGNTFCGDYVNEAHSYRTPRDFQPSLRRRPAILVV